MHVARNGAGQDVLLHGALGGVEREAARAVTDVALTAYGPQAFRESVIGR